MSQSSLRGALAARQEAWQKRQAALWDRRVQAGVDRALAASRPAETREFLITVREVTRGT